MPLHHQYSGRTPGSDGRPIDLPASLVLRLRGPSVGVAIAVSQELENKLIATNQPVAAPITGLALLDTGASATCVGEQVASRLGVTPIDVVQISSASHAAAPKFVYPIRLRLLGTEL